MKIRTLGLGILALLLITASSYADGRYYDNGCRVNYGSGFQVGGFGGGFYPRPFFGAPVIGFATWAPRPVFTRTVVYETRRVQSVYTDQTLARVQVRLAKLGYYDGMIDGDFGPRTARAIRMYQAENGFPVTGRLDNRTLRGLGV